MILNFVTKVLAEIFGCIRYWMLYERLDMDMINETVGTPMNESFNIDADYQYVHYEEESIQSAVLYSVLSFVTVVTNGLVMVVIVANR